MVDLHALLQDPKIEAVLERAYDNWRAQRWRLAGRFLPLMPRLLLRRKIDWHDMFARTKDMYLPLEAEQGGLLYVTARAIGARRVAEFRRATTIAPDGDPLSRGYLSWALGLAGKRQEALAGRTELERRRGHEYFSGWLLAYVSVGLGEHGQAISWLEKAAEECDGLLPFVNEWFAFDPLRADPRFQALLRRMNFPEMAAPS